MNRKVYNRICKKIGHDWAFKDQGTWMIKICLNCGCEQYFFPEEVNELANVDYDHTEEE